MTLGGCVANFENCGFGGIKEKTTRSVAEGKTMPAIYYNPSKTSAANRVVLHVIYKTKQLLLHNSGQGLVHGAFDHQDASMLAHLRRRTKASGPYLQVRY